MARATEIKPEPTPQPELHEPRVRDPGLRDFTRHDMKAIVIRAGKESMNDQITDTAAALAYYGFMAIPALMLVALGFFAVVASPSAIDSVVERIGTVAPQQTVELLDDSLRRMQRNQGGGLAIIVIGLLVALWTTTGAMNALMRGLNHVYDRDESRGFVKQRAVALVMLAALLLAFALVFGLLVLGPHISRWIGDAIGFESFFSWIWWSAQWPILLFGLLLAFAVILALGPDIGGHKASLITLGSLVAVLLWLLASGLFAVYVSMFASYNKAWGSLAAVIIMLTWLWLSALALLFGAEINAEARRTRALRSADSPRAPQQA
jgi:membrane protein